MSYETNYNRYKELNDTYKIKYGTHGLLPADSIERFKMSLLDVENALKDYDIVVERCGSVYAGIKYKVLRNVPKLSSKDLAIICDRGNLCFGYRTEGGYIIVYTD